jgi:hypothetical protein
MQEEEYQSLLAHIQAEGLREPIWTYRGKIIDGRHRYLVCQQLGIEPSYQEWRGNGSLVEFVVGQNIGRRHLTSSQKAMIGAEIEKLLAKEAAERRLANLKRGTTRADVQKTGHRVFGRSSDQAALLLGTNGQYILDAKHLEKYAPDLKESVKNGTLTIPEAKQLSKLPVNQRTEVLQIIANESKTVKAAILSLKRAAVAGQRQTLSDRPIIAHASWEHWLPAQAPCDLLLTDPPYSTEVKEIERFAQDWLPAALAKVKESGRAYVCIGAYPRELRAYLAVPIPAHMRLLQVLAWTYKNTLGPSPLCTYKQNWQAILYFIGRNAPNLDCPLLSEQFAVQDINAPDGRLGDRFHTWQKPDELAERLVRHSTRPGATVYDPFCGTGTFLLAASRLGRVGLGCDSSEAMLALAEKRGCAITRSVCCQRSLPPREKAGGNQWADMPDSPHTGAGPADSCRPRRTSLHNDQRAFAVQAEAGGMERET